MRSIETEVLLLQGDRDRIVPISNYRMLLAQLPHARGLLMPGVGHQPHFTHPEWLAQAIGDFLSDRTSAEAEDSRHLVASSGRGR